MAVTHHNTTASSNTAIATSVTVNKPTLSDGDWMVAHIMRLTGAVLTQPGGWTPLIEGHNGGREDVWVKYVPVAASESASNYTWSWTGSFKNAATITSVSGAAPTNIYDAFIAIDAITRTAVSPIVFPRLYSRKTTGLSMLFHGSVGANSSITISNGYTQSSTFQTGTGSGSDTRITAAYKALVGAVPVATSHTYNTPRANGVVHLMMKAASTPQPYAIRSYTASSNASTTATDTPMPVLWSPGDLHLVVQSARVAGGAPSLSSAPTGYAQVGSTITKNNAGPTSSVAQAT